MATDSSKAGRAGIVLLAGGTPALIASLSGVMARDGHRVSSLESPDAAERVIASRRPDVLLIGGDTSGEQGLRLLKRIRNDRPETQIVVLSASSGMAEACSRARAGVIDFVAGLNALPEQIGLLVGRAVERGRLLARLGQLEPGGDADDGLPGVIGPSLLMREIARNARGLASGDGNILIEGEEGTGRALIARAIHLQGPRKDAPFIRMRGAEPPDALSGMFARAGRGTIMIEDVDMLRRDAQQRLLAALEAREQEVIQGSKAVGTQARIVGLTSADLDLQVQRGQFEGQLFRRLKGASLRVPPLRDRQEDIPVLVRHFMRKEERDGTSSKGIDTAALNILCQYDWPGNVQELEDCVSYARAVAGGQRIQPDHLPEKLVQSSQQRTVSGVGGALSLKGYEKNTIEHALSLCDGDILRAAKMLGIGRSTLYRKMKFHGIRRRQFRRPRRPSS